MVPFSTNNVIYIGVFAWLLTDFRLFQHIFLALLDKLFKRLGVILCKISEHVLVLALFDLLLFEIGCVHSFVPCGESPCLLLKILLVTLLLHASLHYDSPLVDIFTRFIFLNQVLSHRHVLVNFVLEVILAFLAFFLQLPMSGALGSNHVEDLIGSGHHRPRSIDTVVIRGLPEIRLLLV